MLNSDETLAQKFVKKGFWLYLFTFLTSPLGYVVKIMLSRDLTVAEFGMIYGAISLVTLLSAFNDLGCTESLNYFLPKYLIEKNYGKVKYLLRIVLKAQLISNLIIITLLFFGAPWLAKHYFHVEEITSILRIACLYFLWSNIAHVSSALFSASQNTKLQKWTEFFRLMMTVIWVSTLLFSGYGNTENYMWIWVIAMILTSIVASYFAYRYYHIPYFKNIRSAVDIELRTHFFKYALATLLTANIGLILSQIDTQLIIYFLGVEANGYYSNYLSLIMIPFFFISPIATFLFPVLSELHSKNDIIKMRLIHERFSLYFILIGIWISVFLFQFWPNLALLFFGTNFVLSGEILRYSAPFLIFNLLILINFQFLAGTGQIWSRAQSLLVALPINLILNLILIHTLGVQWSALAVGISWISLWAMSAYYTRTYHAALPLRPIITNLLAAGIASLILIGVSRLGISQSLVILLLAVCTNLAIFCLANFSLLREWWTTIRLNRH